MSDTTSIASIVPSTRDFLQTIATQRKRLVLVPLVEGPDDAKSLAHAGVAVFAVSTPGEAMRFVSDSIGSSPILSLAPVANEEEALIARSRGADAVVVTHEVLEAAAWDHIAKSVSSTHMVALATVVDAKSAALAAMTRARGAYLRADAVASVPALAAKIASLRIIAHLPSIDETAVRALRGVVDAVIVDSDFYLSTSFDTLREELDP